MKTRLSVLIVLISSTIAVSVLNKLGWSGAFVVLVLAILWGFYEWILYRESLLLDQKTEERIKQAMQQQTLDLKHFVKMEDDYVKLEITGLKKELFSSVVSTKSDLSSQVLELVKKFDNLNATSDRHQNDIAMLKNTNQKH